MSVTDSRVLHGDCIELMRTLPDNSVDAVVTDPPYGLSFMGKKWDYDVPSVEVWAECLRVLKPGGHLLAFAGTRTQHRMAVRIEDAGFEIRDMIAWVYGSGFPKSLDVSKAIAKRAGGALAAREAVAFMRARREELGLSRVEFERRIFGRSDGNVRNWEEGISIPAPGLWAGIKRAMALDVTPFDADMERGDEEVGRDGGSYGYQQSGDRWEKERILREPATEAAKQWQGWGTALKPALEPITVARKPLEGTVAENVLAHGTGALNIDGCRVLTDDDLNGGRYSDNKQSDDGNSYERGINERSDRDYVQPAGRWPANLIHDGSDEVVGLFPDAKAGVAVRSNSGGNTFGGNNPKPAMEDMGYGDTGSAARFFYCAKASKADRDEGCDGLPLGDAPGSKRSNPAEGRSTALGAPRANHHPTVKPTALMRYLCRLVTPPGGTVLDTFMGSGSTGKAAKLEGFNFIGIEREAEYVSIAEARIAEVQRQLGLFA